MKGEYPSDQREVDSVVISYNLNKFKYFNNVISSLNFL